MIYLTYNLDIINPLPLRKGSSITLQIKIRNKIQLTRMSIITLKDEVTLHFLKLSQTIVFKQQ